MALFSTLLFYAVEISARFYGGVKVLREPASQVWEDIVAHIILNPVSSGFLALPYIIVGLLSARVAHRATLKIALWIFGPCIAVLGMMYWSGQMDSMEALNARKWTASALALGLRPFTAVPIVLGAGVLQWLAVRKYRLDLQERREQRS